MTVAARRWAWAVGLVLGVVLILPASAFGEQPPTLLSAQQRAGHLVATWSLPPGVQTDQLVVAADGTPDQDFGFTSPDWMWWADTGDLARTQTSFTSPDTFDPGTYYVRVGGIATFEPMDTLWSNIRSFVVPRPVKPKPKPVKPKTGRYKGRTEFPDSRPIRFYLSRSRRRVTKLKVRFRIDCQQGLTPVGQLLARLTFKPIRVRRGWKFKRTGKVRYRNGGRLSVTVTGRFKAPTRARGTVTAKARFPHGVRCVYFPIRRPKWTARRR